MCVKDNERHMSLNPCEGFGEGESQPTGRTVFDLDHHMARRRTVGFDKGLTSRVGVRTEVAQNRRRFAPKQAINGRAEQLLAERRATGETAWRRS